MQYFKTIYNKLIQAKYNFMTHYNYKIYKKLLSYWKKSWKTSLTHLYY